MNATRNNTANRTFINVFDELFNAFPTTWEKDANRFSTSNVPVNIHEDAQGYHLEVNAPGRNKEDFFIKLEQNLLVIGSEVKEAEKTEYKIIRREFKANNFKRSFTLDNKIDAEGIQAKYDNGILKVFLPKKEEVKNAPKQIIID
jgi:HSP20 family protein